MKLDPILTKATRAVQKGRYADAIHLLESEAVRYHDSFRYFYILATSCLYAGDFGGAYTYLKRAREIKMRDPYTLIGIAALHLRSGGNRSGHRTVFRGPGTGPPPSLGEKGPVGGPKVRGLRKS